jgi:SAM-dependent MidA family methyltransferase
MNSLKEKIIHRIHEEGPISFETFMEMSLYYPSLGYYTKDSTAIGKEGDFYTSPHLHPLFGAMIGRQIQEMWNVMGRPHTFRIVELGAGMGHLAKDMLAYLKARGKEQGAEGEYAFFDRLRYSIIELNPSMRSQQQMLLKDYPDTIEWCSCIHELGSVLGCFISNELLDAFPIKMVEMDDRLKEIYVTEENNQFVELKKPCDPEVLGYIKDFGIELSYGYRTEVNLRIRDWLKGVSSKLLEGFVLTIDYGYPAWNYYHEERRRGTFLCYYRHQLSEDPYKNIGEQDMTAHVNFSSLKKWGEGLGLETMGFCSQGNYLVSLGIDEVINELYGESPDSFELAKIKGLILPQGMGESHKVMVQYKGDVKPGLRGFSLRNQKGEL